MHLKWHHASSAKMHSILSGTGAPESVLKQIPSIVDTCTTCRGLTAPGQRSMTASRTVTRFNDIVQHDLLANGDHVKKDHLQFKESKPTSSKGDTPALRNQMSDSGTLTEKVPWQHMIDCRSSRCYILYMMINKISSRVRVIAQRGDRIGRRGGYSVIV